MDAQKTLKWSQRLSTGPYLVLIYLILGTWAAITLFGFFWIVLTSFKTNRELFGIRTVWGLPDLLQWENYVRAWTRSQMGNFLLKSIWVSALSVFLIDLVGAMAAYVLARFQFAGNRLILGYFILGSAIPLQLITVPLYLMFNDLGLRDSLIALTLVYVAISMPFTVFVLTGFFKSIPTALEEAAVLDGASDYAVFWRVMLPLATPGLFAGFVIMLLPTIAAFIFLQDRITRGMTVCALKG